MTRPGPLTRPLRPPTPWSPPPPSSPAPQTPTWSRSSARATTTPLTRTTPTSRWCRSVYLITNFFTTPAYKPTTGSLIFFDSSIINKSDLLIFWEIIWTDFLFLTIPDNIDIQVTSVRKEVVAADNLETSAELLNIERSLRELSQRQARDRDGAGASVRHSFLSVDSGNVQCDGWSGLSVSCVGRNSSDTYDTSNSSVSSQSTNHSNRLNSTASNCSGDSGTQVRGTQGSSWVLINNSSPTSRH